MDGKCSQCPMKKPYCVRPTGTPPPVYCSSGLYEAALARADAAYTDPMIRAFAQDAARQEAAGYTNAFIKAPDCRDTGDKAPVKPRIQEVVEFCHRQGFLKIGLAFCGGLKREAALLTEILEAQGLELVSAICKVGARPKESMGLADAEKVRPGQFEPMCNPIAQAMILNEAGCQFNLVLGLCVGHDSLFFKYSDALCTVIAVKDRLLGHNPLAALYTSNSYYSFLKKPGQSYTP